MPELPEVETTRRGIAPALIGQRISRLIVREPRLRWRITKELAERAQGQRVLNVRRRAKYLVIDLERGALIVHLGMSGSLRVLTESIEPLTHDHVDILTSDGKCIRFNDPRRFGCVLWVDDDPLQHSLLKSLAPEPLSEDFDATYLQAAAKGRRVAIKQLLMNSQVVVGVGNIYASEALFRAGVRPKRAAGRLKKAEFAGIVDAVKKVLSEAIEVGGTTLRDYINPQGMPGYFKQKLFVYERSGEPCRKCRTPIRHFTQGQRSTYYCPKCQS